MELLGIVESILYQRRLPDAMFNLAYYKIHTKWPPATGGGVPELVRRNAAWKREQDMQVCALLPYCRVPKFWAH